MQRNPCTAYKCCSAITQRCNYICSLFGLLEDLINSFNFKDDLQRLILHYDINFNKNKVLTTAASAS